MNDKLKIGHTSVIDWLITQNINKQIIVYKKND